MVRNKDGIDEFHILGVKVNPLTVEALQDRIRQIIKDKRKSLVFNVNVNAINIAYRDREFKEILNKAEIVHCDGFGVILGARILGHRVPERISYADWLYHLSDFCQRNNFSLFFLGGKPGTADQAAKKLKERFSDLKVVGIYHGYFEKNGSENQRIIEMINAVRPNILLVGLGMPLQEKWIYGNYKDIRADVFLAGGACFSFVSGEIRRAPRWMIRLELEWLFRLCQEPRRLWKRYLLGNTIFLFLLTKEVLIYLINRTKPALTLFSIKKILDPQEPNSLATKLRKKCFNLFKSLIASSPRPLKILDLGGTQIFWERMGFYEEKDIEIWLLNLVETKINYPNFKSIIGDARDMRQFKNKEFEVVFSNSCIEHLGSFYDQLRMANEVRRVGKRYFIQTPYRFFPKMVKVWLMTNFDLGWYGRFMDKNLSRREVESIRLLNKKELKMLFPDGKIIEEKFFGLTKSLIVYKM